MINTDMSFLPERLVRRALIDTKLDKRVDGSHHDWFEQRGLNVCMGVHR